MSRHQKILARLLSGSKNIAFLEFVSLLEGYGFELDRIRGSHQIYTHPDVSELIAIQPRHDGKAKPYQLRQFMKLVEAYNLELNED